MVYAYGLKSSSASPSRALPAGLKPGPSGLVLLLHSTGGFTNFLYIVNIGLGLGYGYLFAIICVNYLCYMIKHQFYKTFKVCYDKLAVTFVVLRMNSSEANT